MGIENGGPDVSEVLRAQQEFEEKQRIEKEAADAAVQREQDLKAQSGPDHDKRDEVLREMNPAVRELREMESKDIPGRIAVTDQKREQRLAKENDLEATNTQLAELEERYKTLNAAKNEAQYGVSPELSKAIEEMGIELQKYREQARNISANIEAIRAEEVPDEETQRYNQLQADISRLDSQMVQLESNPALVEMLYDEASEHNRAISEIRTVALELRKLGAWPVGRDNKVIGDRTSTAEQRFVDGVCTRFVEEEIARLKIDDMPLPQKRNAITTLINNIRMGMTTLDTYGMSDTDKLAQETFDDRNIKDDNKEEWTRQRISGVALANLIGGGKPAENAIGILASSLSISSNKRRLSENFRANSENFRNREVVNNTTQAIIDHLGTFNFIRAQASVLGETERKKVMGRMSDVNSTEMNSLNSQVNRYHEQLGHAVMDKPIIPPYFDEAQKRAIAEQFERDRHNGSKDAERELGDAKAIKQKELDRSREWLESLKQDRDRIDSANKVLKGKEDTERQKKAQEERMKIMVKDKADLQDDYDNSGPQSFFYRRNIRQSIESREKSIAEATEEISRLASRIEEADEATRLKGEIGMRYINYGQGPSGTTEERITANIKTAEERISKLEQEITMLEQEREKASRKT